MNCNNSLVSTHIFCRLLMWIKAHFLSLSIKRVKDNEKCERDINPYSLGYERVS